MASKRLKIPDSEALIAGGATPELIALFNDIDRFIASAGDVFSSGFLSGIISYPEDGDYRLVVNIPAGKKIVATTTVCSSGSCTATFKINSTALGGAANAVSTSEDTQAHSSDNSMVTGDDLVLTVSSNAMCERMSFTIAVEDA